MKIKIDLEEGESLDDADEFLEKALKAKKKAPNPERYHDQAFEDFYQQINERHEDVLKNVALELKELLESE